MYSNPLLHQPLSRLFIPRPHLTYWPPLDRGLDEKEGPKLNSVGQYLSYLKDAQESEKLPGKDSQEPNDKKAQLVLEKEANNKISIKRQQESWNPKAYERATKDAFKTIFVGRLSYDVTESQLRHEFEKFGHILSIFIIRDTITGKAKGYAFIEFERDRDARAAYHEADGLKINGRRVVVDVERGRTVRDWKPRRLGGGLGYTRLGPKWKNQTNSGRDNRAATSIDRKRSHSIEARESSSHRYVENFRDYQRRDNYDRYSSRDSYYEKRYDDRHHRDNYRR